MVVPKYGLIKTLIKASIEHSMHASTEHQLDDGCYIEWLSQSWLCQTKSFHVVFLLLSMYEIVIKASAYLHFHLTFVDTLRMSIQGLSWLS